MIRYSVLTKQGKITKSEPELPISTDDLHWVNTRYLGTLYEGLQHKIPNLVHCEIVNVDIENDVVSHILVQLT